MAIVASRSVVERSSDFLARKHWRELFLFGAGGFAIAGVALHLLGIQWAEDLSFGGTVWASVAFTGLTWIEIIRNGLRVRALGSAEVLPIQDLNTSGLDVIGSDEEEGW